MCVVLLGSWLLLLAQKESLRNNGNVGTLQLLWLSWLHSLLPGIFANSCLLLAGEVWKKLGHLKVQTKTREE